MTDVIITIAAKIMEDTAADMSPRALTTHLIMATRERREVTMTREMREVTMRRGKKKLTNIGAITEGIRMREERMKTAAAAERKTERDTTLVITEKKKEVMMTVRRLNMFLIMNRRESCLP